MMREIAAVAGALALGGTICVVGASESRPYIVTYCSDQPGPRSACIAGQETALAKITEYRRRAKRDIRDDHRPLHDDRHGRPCAWLDGVGRPAPNRDMPCAPAVLTDWSIDHRRDHGHEARY